MREKYGMHLFGQATLVARRLIEAGTRFATVFWDDFGETANAWDTHFAHYPNMRNVLCPGLDQSFVALIEDLEARGRLDDTLVVCMSEHGRGFRVTSDPRSRGGGRGHWSEAYSIMLAGGGIARGKVVGETDKRGAAVLDTPVSPKDILATMYHLLGIDPDTTIRDPNGVPSPIGGGGRIRTELLA
jgi:arylsulfatase A-like enzyme